MLIPLFFILFYPLCESKGIPLPQMSDLARLRPNIHYTIARQHDALEFICDQEQKILLWILPNNQIVKLNQSLGNETLIFQKSSIILTKVSDLFQKRPVVESNP